MKVLTVGGLMRKRTDKHIKIPGSPSQYVRESPWCSAKYTGLRHRSKRVQTLVVVLFSFFELISYEPFISSGLNSTSTDGFGIK